MAEVDVLSLTCLAHEFLEALRNVLVLVHQVQSSLYLHGATPKSLSNLVALSLDVQHCFLMVVFINGLGVYVSVFVLKFRVV